MSRFCTRCGEFLPAEAKFCPQCGLSINAFSLSNAEASDPSTSRDGKMISKENETFYNVFLSYSHRDRDHFGMEYILRIKKEIEDGVSKVKRF